jgi:hypothetical protein
MSSFFINPNFFTAPASWVPTDVSGCVLWFDASNAASITSSGGAVSQWADLSGNSNHANQSTAGLKPALGTDATTGYGKITFNGSNDVLVVTHSSSINLVTGISAFLVCNATGSACRIERLQYLKQRQRRPLHRKCLQADHFAYQ